MLYEIRGEQISAVIDSLGAQIMSVKKDDTEYLWQGDAKYWKDRALTLFPYCQADRREVPLSGKRIQNGHSWICKGQ